MAVTRSPFPTAVRAMAHRKMHGVKMVVAEKAEVKIAEAATTAHHAVTIAVAMKVAAVKTVAVRPASATNAAGLQ